MTIENKAIELKREYQRKWREKNKEKLNAYYKEWRKNNPEKIKEYDRNYWEKRAAKELKQSNNKLNEKK